MVQRTDRLDLLVKNTQALYELCDDDVSNSELVHDYAKFKLGDVTARNRFLDELVSLVWLELAQVLGEFGSEWIIVTPATTELAQDFSDRLRGHSNDGQFIDVLVVGPDPHPDSDYTGCSHEQRRCKVDAFYDFQADLSGKRVLIIDDFVNTGTALRSLMVRLCSFGVKPSDIESFVFVRGRFAEPQREFQLVSEAIGRMRLDEVLSILEHPNHYVTSATMLKYLASRSMVDLRRVAKKLPRDRIAVLRRGLRHYYRRHPVPGNLAVLLASNDAVRSRGDGRPN